MVICMSNGSALTQSTIFQEQGIPWLGFPEKQNHCLPRSPMICHLQAGEIGKLVV